MIDYDSHYWIRYLFKAQGNVAPKIAWRVLAITAWAAIVFWVDREVVKVGTPSTIHTLLGIAVSLLLVFRTNASYERFWEGRKLWGGIVNECRNLARGATTYLGPQGAPVIRWTVVFPYACMSSLRGLDGAGIAAPDLPPAEMLKIEKARHRPTAVALQISGLIAGAKASGQISDYVAMNLDGYVQRLIDCIGGCERIQKTPLPFAYILHLRWALVIYLATLPFALVDSYGWSSVLDVLAITYVLLGIEEIGMEIENPFGYDFNDLPLEAICKTIETDLRNLLNSAS